MAAGVRGVTPLLPDLKPRLPIGEGRRDAWILRLAERGPRGSWFTRSRATLTVREQDGWLALPQVLGIEERHHPRLHDEIAGLILAGRFNAAGLPEGSYLEWLQTYQLDGAGVTIGIVDSGIEMDHPAFAGRIRDLTGGKRSWHGTAVAGLAAGRYLDERDDRGFFYGLGVAPGADLLAQDRFAAPETLCCQTVTSCGPAGVLGTVQNNSFGKGTHDPMDYRSEEATYDRLVRNADPEGSIPRPLTICFSAGNEGRRGLTRPAAAKNVLVTGTTSVYRPQDGGIEAERIDEVYVGDYDTRRSASSHGNCGDQRVRPHVVAPGQWAATANFQAQPGEKRFLSRRLAWSSGSSAASALTAGACALLTQWWRQETGAHPSPALLRAMIVNGAVDIRDGGPIPNSRQGWGRLSIDNVISPAVCRCWLDQTAFLVADGEERTWDLHRGDPALPLKITLSWTDPPGPLGSGTADLPAVVNRLALRAVAGSHVYHGNRFAGGWSCPEANALAAGAPRRSDEGCDNLQNIYLPPAAALGGVLRVTVRALELAADALTGEVEHPRQDFALWISNCAPLGASAETPVRTVARRPDRDGPPRLFTLTREGAD